MIEVILGYDKNLLLLSVSFLKQCPKQASLKQKSVFQFKEINLLKNLRIYLKIWFFKYPFSVVTSKEQPFQTEF